MTKKNELFKKLLDQIKFPDKFEDNDIVQNGEIENVDVYANERKWKIHVFFDTPLDFETYRSLNELIYETFEPFVNVELLVQTRDGSSKKLPAYWTYAIQNSTNLKPAVREFLQGQAPHLEKEKWLIPTQNQVVNGLLSEQVLAELNKEFRRYGFFNIKFTTKVDETNIDENLISLEQEQAQHESAMQEFYI